MLQQEVAYIALHFHWSYETIMNMEHQERREWVQEIARQTGASGARGQTDLSWPNETVYTPGY